MLEDAIEEVLGKHPKDSGRLSPVADYAKAELSRLGLPSSSDDATCELRGGTGGELTVSGLARAKDWDVAFDFAGKPRLLLSLKSIWSNASGAIPNRLDDLMGEAANVQQRLPEVVIGYILLFETSADSHRKADGRLWSKEFESAVERIAVRRFPLWNQGLLESAWFVRFDESAPKRSRVIRPASTAAAGRKFFESLLCELKLREPAVPFTKPIDCSGLGAAVRPDPHQTELEPPSETG